MPKFSHVSEYEGQNLYAENLKHGFFESNQTVVFDLQKKNALFSRLFYSKVYPPPEEERNPKSCLIETA